MLQQTDGEISLTISPAIHIYMGGVAVQQFFILVFIVYAVKFHRIVLHQNRQAIEGASSALQLLYAIYGVLLLITACRSVSPQIHILTSLQIRIIFRIVEYSHGFKSDIPDHEAYQYALDSVPMLFALIVLNVVHPGRIMSGKECDLPSRKERKVEDARDKAGMIGGALTA
jgi:hypothetical protein